MIEYFSSKSVNTFIKQLRSIIHNYWNKNLDIEIFEGEFNEIVQKQLTLSYEKIGRQYGVSPKFYSKEEKEFLDEQIAIQQSFIANFTNQIEEAKNGDGDIQSFFNRVPLWANRWNEIESNAHTVFGKDRILEFVLGTVIEHCRDCVGLNGTKKRASLWKQSKLKPQSESLACKGFNCNCYLRPVGPIS